MPVELVKIIISFIFTFESQGVIFFPKIHHIASYFVFYKMLQY